MARKSARQRRAQGKAPARRAAAHAEKLLTGEQTYDAADGLGAALGRGYDAREFTDAQIVAGLGPHARTFAVHAWLLSWRSPYFRRCFSEAEAGTSERVLRVPHIRPGTMEQVVRFVYSGRVQLGEDDEATVALLEAATELELPALAQCAAGDLVGRCSLEGTPEAGLCGSRKRRRSKR